MRRIGWVVVAVLLLSSCGYPFPLSARRTDILVREGESGVELLFCPEAEIAVVRIEGRDRGPDGEWADYQVLFDEDDLQWQSGPASPFVLAAEELPELNAPLQLSILLKGSRAGDDMSALTLIEITPAMKDDVSAGSWINTEGVVDHPCAE